MHSGPHHFDLGGTKSFDRRGNNKATEGNLSRDGGESRGESPQEVTRKSEDGRTPQETHTGSQTRCVIFRGAGILFHNIMVKDWKQGLSNKINLSKGGKVLLDQFRFDFLPCCGGNVRVYVWDVTAAFQESSPMSELCTSGAT